MFRYVPSTFARSLRVAGVVLPVLACSSSDAVAPPLAPCTEGTQITSLPTNTSGSVTWTPACAVSFVAIVDSSENVAVWGIRTSTPVLSSPQEMYVTPTGAYNLGITRKLRADSSYYAILGVRYTDPETGRIGERGVAIRYFRP